MTDTSALVAFIRERLDEDELWALAASAPNSWRGNHPPIPTGVRWTWAVRENWEPYEPNPLEEYIGEGASDTAPTLITVDEWPYDEPLGRWTHFQHQVIARGEEVRTADGAHIARHDPARVLRDVEFGRQLLQYICGELADDETDASAEWQLQILAARWSDHPDYREEWRP